MRRTAGAFLAVVLMAGSLGLPAELSAKTRRGALVVVTKSDGARVKGELVSVKPDSLLLLRSGGDLTVPRNRIQSVTVMRRSRMASSALKGFIFGALPGVAWGIGYGDSGSHGIRTPVKAGAFTGVLGLAIGMAAGRGEKAESVVPLADLGEPAATGNWEKLVPYSRAERQKTAAKRPRP
jgi:hypothetical protein